MYYQLPPRPGQPIVRVNQQVAPCNSYLYSNIVKSKTRQHPANNQHRYNKQHQQTNIYNNNNSNHVNNDNMSESTYAIARKQFAFIKSMHHLEKLQTSTPKTWKGWGDNIANNIRLAFSNDITMTKYKSLTDNFINELVATAKTHYNTVVNDAEAYLKDNCCALSATDCDNSIKHVRQWVNNQLGKKISRQSLEASINKCQSFYGLSRQVILFVTIVGNKRSVSLSPTVTVSPVITSNRFVPNSSAVTEEVVCNSIITHKSATATSKKQVKQKNTSRFFFHSQTQDDDDDQHSQISAFSQQHGNPPPSSGNIVHRVSMGETAIQLERTAAPNVLLGDENWKDYLGDVDFSCFLCSGKITALRAILDKVKHKNSSVNKLVICISSNNTESATALPLIKNINKAAHNKFPNAQIFYCLAGICNSLSADDQKLLESINNNIRSFKNVTLINPPDGFSTINGSTFTNASKNSFYNNLNSFLT